MDILKLSFENCYGIKKFEHVFDFSHGCVQAIYAPNGAMKSSFSKVFDDFSKNEVSKDRVFSNRNSTVSIKCNHDESDLELERVFVIERYKEEIKQDRVSTLLVNHALKQEYDAILNSIKDKQDHLLKNLQKHSGLKTNLQTEISTAFGKSEMEFSLVLISISNEINNDVEAEYPQICYKDIFNDKVIAFLNSPEFKSKLDEYLDTYEQLIANSNYFKKGIFTHNNADTISKTLSDNGFFKAQHSVSLSSVDGKKELNSQKDLDDEISSEKNKILTNEDLSKKFALMDKAIQKNNELKDFRNFLENNPQMRIELRDLSILKKKLWLSYIKVEAVLYNEWLEAFLEGSDQINKIVQKAKDEEAQWKKVVDMFNSRFKVPFNLLVKNQEDVILNNAAPSIVFEYQDGDEVAEVGGAELINILSTGEQRALYLLNILFEIENRKAMSSRSLIIIDDIADSFDYKNKYAIIEYLKDMIDCGKFRMIILTHNFDFYRTIQSRLPVNKWQSCYLSVKSNTEVRLVNGKDHFDIFASLKSNYPSDRLKLITVIPFIRNLIEYTVGSTSIDYLTLTSVLHYKNQKVTENGTIRATTAITVKEIEDIFNNLFRSQLPIENSDALIFEEIMDKAETISMQQVETVSIENKIVLSIAIRLKAELFMINKINEPEFIDGINKNQTTRLYNKYSQKFATDSNSLSVLNRVNIMTPENIHVNSFMYEPILDLSDHHLIQLFNEVNALN